MNSCNGNTAKAHTPPIHNNTNTVYHISQRLQVFSLKEIRISDYFVGKTGFIPPMLPFYRIKTNTHRLSIPSLEGLCILR